jgi:ADP-heptose:LPS heptosyltransferase
MNVLLVRPDGIGDEILCLPVATALRRLMPQARIAFLSTAYAAPILEHHPDLDEVLTVTGRESLSDLVRFFQRRFDAAIFLKPFRRLMWAAFLARVPIRVATGYRWYSLLANRRVYEHRSRFAKHESVYNGLDPPAPSPPRLELTADERAAARRRLQSLPAPRVVLHPGGFAARRWRSEHYGELAALLVHRRSSVIMTGSPDEGKQFAEAVLSRKPLPKEALDLMGALSVRELMAVIAESQAVVSGATGPAHIAAACGVPNVALFDPRRNNLPTRWQPLGTGVVLRPDVPTCEKCIYEACPYWDCLDRLTVEAVADHVSHVVAGPAPLQVVHV